MGSFSLWHWIIVLIIVVLVFGTKKLRNVGKDLGGAVHDFKQGLNEGTDGKDAKKDEVIEHKKDEDKHNPCLISVWASCCWSALSP